MDVEFVKIVENGVTDEVKEVPAGSNVGVPIVSITQPGHHEDGSNKFESHLDNPQNRSSGFQRVTSKMEEVPEDPQTKVLKSEAKVAENPLWDGFTWHIVIQTEVSKKKTHICFGDIYSQQRLPDGSKVINVFGGITLYKKTHKVKGASNFWE